MIGCTIQCDPTGLWCYCPQAVHINLIVPIKAPCCFEIPFPHCCRIESENDILSRYCTCPSNVNDPQIYSECVFDTNAISNGIDAQKYRKQSQNKLENKNMITNNSCNSETSFFQQSQEEEKLINTDDNNNDFERIQLLLSKLSPQRNKIKDNVEQSSKYYLRKDVITKSILRSMRKYYFNEFKAYYDFTKVNALIEASTPTSKCFVRAREYLAMKFNKNCTNDMVGLLLCLLDPNGKFFILSEDYHELRSLVYKLLYKYNRPTLEEIIVVPHFIEFFTKFIRIPSLIGNEIKFRNDDDCRSAYQKQVELFKMICECNSIKLSKILLTFL